MGFQLYNPFYTRETYSITFKPNEWNLKCSGDYACDQFSLTGIFLFNGPPLLTLRSWESWIEGEMTSKAHQFKNAMCVYATELSFQTFKFAFYL